MTLFELINSEERMFIFSKLKMEIYSLSSSYLCDVLISEVKFISDIIDDIPYHLLRRKVVKAIYHEDVIKIYVK